jgi:serine phosphatase RsbU (regulator of sigma subunit)/anti-sigma regulatory factor (Ser/Thr protein kinase)
MDEKLSDILAEIQKTWIGMTAGGFACFIGDRQVLGFDQQTKLPKKVQNALDHAFEIDAYTYRGRKWWVVQSSTQGCDRLRFVAWTKAEESKSYHHLLQTWLDVITYGFREENLGQNLTEALVGAWDRLSFFYEFTHIVSQATDLPELMIEIIALLEKVIFVEDVFIVLREDGEYQTFTASEEDLPDADLLLSLIENSTGPVSMRELKDDFVQAGSSLAEYGDLLVARLALDGQTSGMMGFLDALPGRFTANDIQLLASAADRVCSIIESMRSRLIWEERQRIERELEVAARIQASLLPDELPEIPGVDIAVHLQPARHVGGDMYASSKTQDGDLIMILADVAGKGMPAAILTSIVHGTFRGHAPFCKRPADLMKKIGHYIYQDLEKADTFVTAVVMRCLQRQNAFEYASAGHVDVLLWRNETQKVEFLPGTGIPLGIEPEYPYEDRKIQLYPGDLVLVYSDGVTEAEDPEGKVLGLQGLSDIIYATHPARAVDQINALCLGLEVHRQGLPARDDVALLLFRCAHEMDAKRTVIPFVIDSDFHAVRTVVDLIRGLEDTMVDERTLLDKQLLDNFALATSEILTNQIRHAFGESMGRIQGCVMIESNRLITDLYDHGVPIPEPLRVRTFNGPEPQERGYGLMLAEGLLDTCEYHRIGENRNHWRLIKNF